MKRIRALHFIRNQASGRVLGKVGVSCNGSLNQAQEKWGAQVDPEEY